jgi:hypothetical protein
MNYLHALNFHLLKRIARAALLRAHSSCVFKASAPAGPDHLKIAGLRKHVEGQGRACCAKKQRPLNTHRVKNIKEMIQLRLLHI